MAEEEKKEGEGGDAAAAAAGGKVSPIKKLLGSKLIIPIVGVVGLAAGGGLSFTILKSKMQPPPAPVVEGEEGAPAEEGHEAAAPAEHGAPKEEGHGEKKEGGHGAEKKEEKKEGGHGEKKEEKKEGGHGGGEKEAEGGGEPVSDELVAKFDSMVVNIFDKNSIHYLKLKIEIQVDKPEVTAEISSNKSRLQDGMISLISDMSLREILSSGGKALLKDDIVHLFNKVVRSGKVTDVYFTEFTVQ